jgi:hypothetical protein
VAIALLAVALVIAGVGVLALIGSQRTRTAQPVTRPGNVITAEPPAVVDAYRYPLGCLGVAIAGTAPLPVHAEIHRVGPCWRYGVYVTAIFRRVGRAWGLALEARSASCPPRSLPGFVRSQLAICRHPDPRARAR